MRKIYALLVLFLTLGAVSSAWGQCNNTTLYQGGAAPAAGGTTTLSACVFAGEYSQITSVAAATQYISSSTGGTGNFITIRQGTSGGLVIASGFSPLTWTSTVAGTYFQHVNTTSACGTDATCHTSTIQRPVGSPYNPCTTIPTLTCGGTTSYSMAGSAGAWNSYGGPWGVPGEEKLFSFTPTTTGVHNVTVNASAGYVDLFWKAQSSGCNSTGWTYVNDIIGTETSAITLTAGVAYYLMLDNENSTANTGTISVACPTPCAGTTVTLNMFDTYGDGWNGANMSIVNVNTNAVIGTYTFTTGFSSTQSICLPDGCYRAVLNAGGWPTEVGWSLVSGATTIASASSPNAAPFNTTFTIGTGTCTPPANNNCSTPTVVDLGANPSQTISGSSTGSTNDPVIFGANSEFSQTWLQIIVPCGGMNVSLNFCNNPVLRNNAYINLLTNCTASPGLITATNFNFTNCPSGSITLNWDNLPSGTYYYPLLQNDLLWAGAYTVNVIGIPLVTPAVAPVAITGSNTICPGGSTTLTVSGGSLGTGGVWRWYSGSCGGTLVGTGTSINVSPGTNTPYFVRAEGTCNTTSCASQTVTVNSLSTAPTSMTGTNTVCPGGTTTLTPSGGTAGTGAINAYYGTACNVAFEQLWQTQPYGTNETTVNNVNNGILNVTSTGIDPMLYMGGLGSFDPATYRYINIRYRSNTTTSAEIFFYNTAHNFAVGGESVSGTIIGDNNWRILSIDMWTDPDYVPGGSIFGWRFDWAGTSGVTMDIDFIELSQGPMLAEGASFTTPSLTANTTYFTRRIGQCNSTGCASQSVTVNPLPTPSISGTNAICAGGSSTFTASGGLSYLWSTGATTASITVSTAGTYTVTATNTQGCTATASRTLTVNSLPTPSISGINTICAGGSSTFTASGGNSYLWSTGATTASITVSTAGTYTVTATNTQGCTATASRTLTVNPVPTTFSANTLTTTPLCYGSNARIEVPVSQSGISYQLRDNTTNVGGAQTGTGGALTFTSNNLTATNANYNVLATNGLGCTTVVSVGSIGVDGIPTVLGVDGDVRTCYVNGNNAFVEFRSASGSLIAINPGTENLGNVTVTEYVGSPLSSQACGTTQPWYVTSVLGRHWVITPENQPTGPVTVRLYYDNSEYTALAAVANANANPNDDVVAQGSLDLSKYSNPGNPSAVNGVFTDNCAAGGTTTAHVPTGTGLMNALSGYGSFPASGLYNSYSISSFSEFWLSGTNNVSPLPIVLQSFTASCDKGMVKLDWVTATEINNERFTIHRSADLMEWEEVLSQAGAGNSNTPLAYTGVDDRPLNGLSYYRLTQRDYDGTTESFEPISVTCYTDGEGNSMLVFPNPADDRFTVSVTVTEAISNAGIEIMDINGKRVMLKNVNLVKGTNEFTFDRSLMNPGTYFIKLGSGKLALSPIKLIIK